MSFPSAELIAIVVVGVVLIGLVLVIQHGLYNKIDERIDVVDKRLGILDKRMDLADKRMEVLDKRFDAVDGQLVLLERGQAELRERMARIEGSR